MANNSPSIIILVQRGVFNTAWCMVFINIKMPLDLFPPRGQSVVFFCFQGGKLNFI